MKHVIQLFVALLALAGAAASWSQVHRVVDVEPIADGEPATTSVVYYPPLMFLTMVLVAAAGVLVVLGIAGLRRRRACRRRAVAVS